MPEVIGDFPQQRQIVEIRRHQPAKREPVQIPAAGEDDDQIYIPTEADVLSLSDNDTLEIVASAIPAKTI